jgi:hypothetical protein
LIVIGIIFLLGLYFISKSNCVETFTDVKDTSYKKSKMTSNCPDVLIQKGTALFLYNSKRGNVPGVNPIRFENLEEYVEFVDWQRSQGILCPVLFLQHAYNAQGEPVYKARPSPTNLQGGLPDYYVDQNSLPNGVVNSEMIANLMNNPNIMPAPSPVPVQGYLAGTSLGAGTGTSNGMGTSNGTGTDTSNRYGMGLGMDVDSFRPPADGGANSMPNIPCGIVVNDKDHYPGFNTQADIVGAKTAIEKIVFNNLSPNPMDSNWGGMDFTEKLVEAGYYKENEVVRR